MAQDDAPTIVKERYRLIRTIGSGGFGNTWYAFDELLQMPVAIKVFAGSSEKERERYLREARSLAQFWQEPGIVAVRDYFGEGGTFYLVMEYLDGEDLSSYLKREGALSLETTLNLLTPVMTTLAHLHEANVIHRDVSPDNLRILPNGQMKLMDFGTALSTNTSKPGTTVFVKPGYAPPEQYGSPQDQGPWTDVYGLGITIWRCITNRTPQDSIQRTLDDKLSRPSTLGVSIDSKSEAVLMRAIALNPKERLQSVEELSDGLGVALGLPRTSEIEEPKTIREDDSSSSALRATVVGDPKEDLETVILPEETAQGKAPVADDIETEVFKDVGTTRIETAVSTPSTTPAEPTPPMPEQRPPETAAPQMPPVPGDEASAKGNAGKTHTKRPRTIAIVVGAVAVVIVVAVVLALTFANNGTPYRRGSSTTSYLDDTSVTTDVVDTLTRDSETKSLVITSCELDDTSISRIADMKNLESLTLDGCRGFTTLAPLAKSANLGQLTIKSFNDFDGDTMCPVDFPNIENLSFDTVSFTKSGEFLRHFPALQALHLTPQEGIDNVEFLSSCTGIQTLELDGMDLSGDKSKPLAQCSDLQKAHLNSCKLDTLVWASGCAQLNDLEAADNSISSLDGLQGAPELTHLVLSNNQIGDLSPLTGTTKLKEASFDNNQISELDPLQKNKQLFMLNVSQNQVSDTGAAAIGNLSEMWKLDVSNNEIGSLDFCERLLKLEELNASSNHITGLGKLSSCVSMEKLYIHHNEITNIEALANDFNDLTALNVSFNHISSLKPLEKNTSLKHLIANDNQIRNLNGLENKPLEAALLCNNRIDNISELRGSVDKLTYLDLGTNQIEDISTLSQLGSGSSTSNTKLFLEHNKVSSASSLPTDSQWALLSLYDNPLSSINFLANDDMEWQAAYVSYNDSFDFSKISSKSSFKNLRLVGVPYDVQAKLLRDGESSTGTKTPSFKTPEEADSEIQTLRDEVTERVLKLSGEIEP